MIMMRVPLQVALLLLAATMGCDAFSTPVQTSSQVVYHINTTITPARCGETTIAGSALGSLGCQPQLGPGALFTLRRLHMGCPDIQAERTVFARNQCFHGTRVLLKLHCIQNTIYVGRVCCMRFGVIRTKTGVPRSCALECVHCDYKPQGQRINCTVASDNELPVREIHS